MTKVFISHAVKDKKLVDAFVDLLHSGMNIDYNEIFCSSEGRLPSGELFTENIKKHLKESNAVIFILTLNFFQSRFCLNEMGAAWVLEKYCVPIITPLIAFNILENTALKGVQARRINNKNDLIQIFDEFTSFNIINKPTFSRFGTKLDEFIKRMAWTQKSSIGPLMGPNTLEPSLPLLNKNMPKSLLPPILPPKKY